MRIKTVVSSFLRKMYLLNVAEYSRYLLHKLKSKRVNAKFKREHPDIIFPPDFLIYETYKLNLSEYYYDGKKTAAEIVTIISKYFDILQPGTCVLDWGSGPGRIVRHFPELLPLATIFATDYNKKYVAWCDQNLKNVRVSHNSINPPASYENSFFDVIIGISIFTHLSEKNHVAWIDELQRIIKPGGIAFITTQGASFRFKLLHGEKEKFDRDKLVTREEVMEGNRLFSAFQPPLFFQQLIKDKFEVVAFISPEKGDSIPEQDIWVLRRL